MDRLSEYIDKLRVIPRLLVLSYMLAVGLSLNWYFDFEVKYVQKCDSAVMHVVLQQKDATIELAKSVACTDVDVIAQPLGYTALMATLVGAGAGIFGFYVNSGGSTGVRQQHTKDIVK